MFLDVSSLSIGDSINFDFDGEVRIPSDFILANNQPVFTLSGTVFREKEYYFLCAVASTTLEINCDRCLKHEKRDFSFDVNEKYSHILSDDRDIISFENMKINADIAIIINFALNYPMKAICSESCKGLCANCGKDLNLGDCKCGNVYINPAFEMLINLFEDKEV